MRTLDLIEAAEFLRIHPHTLEAQARTGSVPGAKIGKRWVFITALELRLLAKRIQDGKAAVSPAPTFERTDDDQRRMENPLRRAVHEARWVDA